MMDDGRWTVDRGWWMMDSGLLLGPNARCFTLACVRADKSWSPPPLPSLSSSSIHPSIRSSISSSLLASLGFAKDQKHACKTTNERINADGFCFFSLLSVVARTANYRPKKE